MITRQHSAITFMAHSKKGSMQSFKREIPWALQPDGIRAYSGPRQMSHFEETADGTDRAWMIFPNEQVLRNLSKENCLSEEEDARINALNFELTAADKEGIILCDPDDLEDIFDRMNVQAYYFTSREL